MPAFMKLRDIGLFLHSARTDARIKRLRAVLGSAAALEAVYEADPDPWAAASARYRYQRRKYEVLTSLLPPRRFRRALDLGCGLGLLSRHLASRADAVVGIDVAPSAVARARTLHADQPNLVFEAHDLLALPSSFDASFDLVVVADVLYYLSPMDDALLKEVAMRIARLLAPDGICMLANHYFFRLDPDSRQSRRIHDAFIRSPSFDFQSEHRHSFFLTTLLQGVGVGNDNRTEPMSSSRSS
ncbi:MAG: class I SAM-dependent methyltransferase [Novosphingobium sp.]|jgi:SAM-dependent methyltransferase|nr:class I SAM-dependent methyltransferase [Novosphingobium sp.]